MKPIGVDCRFKRNGSVRVRRIKIEENWVSVGQGRQWVDEYGRHILIMLSHNQVREIVLRADTLRWEMTAVSSSRGPRIV
ncbi:MAG: hypothetical protein GY803_05395 [Chloroflexi bacterium]|nr:hypothetical protein [Chloroflexota bacterium]